MSVVEQTNEQKVKAILAETWRQRGVFLEENKTRRPNTVYIDFDSWRTLLCDPEIYRWIETHPVDKLFGIRVVKVKPCVGFYQHVHVTHNPDFEGL